MPNGFEPAQDRRCPFCGAHGLELGDICFACERRWEELECRDLQYRLFGFAGATDLPLPPD